MSFTTDPCEAFVAAIIEGHNEKDCHFAQLCARIVLAFHMLSDGQTDACHETLIDTYHWLTELGYNTENFWESEV